MRICIVARASLGEVFPHGFFASTLTERNVAVETVDCDGQHPIELGLQLAARLENREISRIVIWGGEAAALEMRGIAGIGRMIIVPGQPPGERPASWWQQFQTHQFLAFSRSRHEELLRAGVGSAYFQYFPPAVPPARLADAASGLSALLWEPAGSTVESIQLAAVQCRAMGLQRLQVANCAGSEDPDLLEVLHRDMAGFLDFASMDGGGHAANLEWQLNLHSCFIAPDVSRAFCPMLLGAIAAGRIVVAPDAGWVRDYVGHLATGVLYDPADPVSLPSLDGGMLRDLAAGALARSTRGRERWQADTERLLSILLDDGRRWSSPDRSAEFGNLIRRNASETARLRAATARSAAPRAPRKSGISNA